MRRPEIETGGLDEMRRAGSDSMTIGPKERLFLVEPETPRSLEPCLVQAG